MHKKLMYSTVYRREISMVKVKPKRGNYGGTKLHFPPKYIQGQGSWTVYIQYIVYATNQGQL